MYLPWYRMRSSDVRATMIPAARNRSSSWRRRFSPPRLAKAMSAVTRTPRAAAAISAASMSLRSRRKMAISTLFFARLIAASSGATPSAAR